MTFRCILVSATSMHYKNMEHGCTLYNSSMEQLLNSCEIFDLALFSPPYNIGSKSKKKIGGRKVGGYDSKSFGGISDETIKPEIEYQESQKNAIRAVFSKLSRNGVCVYNHMDRLSGLKCISPEEWLFDLQKEGTLVIRQKLVWDKTSTHNHTRAYVSPQHEYIYVLTKPGAKIFFDKQDFFWKTDKTKSIGSVWRIPRDPKLVNKEHTAPFPLRMARQCIRMWCPPGGLVCDPYTGSGTTLVAAAQEGRRFIGSELLGRYFEIAKKRFQIEFLEGMENQKGIYGRGKPQHLHASR